MSYRPVRRAVMPMIDVLRRDLSQAVRSLRRRPLLSLAALLSLALGIGINTAIFSLFNRLVLEKLAVPEPDGIVLLASPGRKPGATTAGDSGGSTQVFSYPLFRDLERLRYSGIVSLAAHRDFDANVAYGGTRVRAEALLVSGHYFEALRLSPTLGRLLAPQDDESLGAHPVAVISHRYWTSQLGETPGVIGQPLIVNGESLTIVGVGPAGFVGTTAMDAADIFVPLAMAERVHAGGITRRDHWLYLFARLADGAGRRQAENAINGPFHTLIRDVEFPALRDGLADDEVAGFLARRVVLEDGSRTRQQARDRVRIVVSLLFTVSGLVLLIACANIANLLMARALDREVEMAVRISLGASMVSLIRLLLVEATLLGTMGAALALVVARVAFTSLSGLMPSSDAALLQFDWNVPVFAFTTLLGVGCALVFGLVPAIHAARSRPELGPGGRASGSRTAVRFRTSLATLQFALATALLATASLLTASLAGVMHADTGVRTDGLLTFRLAPGLNGYTPARTRTLYDRLTDDLRALPGVTAATATSTGILADNGWNQRVTMRIPATASERTEVVSTMRITTDYFRTLGIPIRAGREFRRSDDDGAPLVAIVNRAFLDQFGLRDGVLGDVVALGAGQRRVGGIEIVGVVENAKYSNMHQAPPAQLYLPYWQAPEGPLTFYVRGRTDVRPLLTTIPAAVARLDASLVLEDLRTMDDQIWENVTRDRVLAVLSSAFAALAVVLAATGLYALLAFSVARRVKEFGIRMAIGASPRDVVSLIARHVGRIAIVGTAIGLAVAVGLGRLGEALLYGIEGRAPLLIAGAGAAMALVAVFSAVIPARRAATVQPAVALRTD